MIIASQIASAFGAGLLTSVSPCVYPMIPISIGYLGSEAKKSRVILFFIGQVLAFTVLGVVAVSLGEMFGFSSENKWVNLTIGSFLLLFGLASFTSYVPPFLQRWNSKQSKFFGGGGNKSSWITPILVGAGSALVASPCTSPILGTVLVTISQAETFYSGVFLMFCYALGTSLIFLGLGLGIVKAKNLPKSGNWMNYMHKASSVLISLVGIYFVYQGI